MATLEKRSNTYRAIFYYAGQRFTRSLKTKSERAAMASLARLEDNVRRAELGLLIVPDSVDIANYLLSDGRLEAKPAVPAVHSIQVFCLSRTLSFKWQANDRYSWRAACQKLSSPERVATAGN
jgi:hypothetical protein